MEQYFILSFAAISALLYFYLSHLYLRRRKLRLPPGPTGLPLLGSLPFLDPELHSHFTNLSRIHGPIFSINLGSKLAVVISSPSLAREALRDNDSTLANRDVPAVAQIIAYGASDIVWSPNGPTWRMLRRVCVQKMLCPASLDAVYSLRRREVRTRVQHLLSSAGKPVDVGALVFLSAMNVITSMLWGGTVGGGGEEVGVEFRGLVGEITELLGKPNLSDFFPGLQRFDVQGIERKMKGLLVRFDGIFDRLIEQRRKMGGKSSTGAKDMLEFMLGLVEDEAEGNVPFTMTHVKALLMVTLLLSTLLFEVDAFSIARKGNTNKLDYLNII